MCFSSLDGSVGGGTYLAGLRLRFESFSLRFLSLALKLSFSLLKFSMMCWIYPSGDISSLSNLALWALSLALGASSSYAVGLIVF